MSEPKEGGESGLELDWGERRRPDDVPSEDAAPVVDPEPLPAVVFTPTAVWAGAEEEAALERRLRRWAVPVALAVAWLFTRTQMGQFLAKIFSGMWLHEVGHAATAWLCGIYAVPGPWRTLIGEGRSWFIGLTLLGAIGYLGYRLWAQRRFGWLWVPALLLVLQAAGTLVLSPSRAQMMITFGGDAGAMLLGAVLMATFYARAESQLRRGWLRWGFLVLGALGFMETAGTWWGAISDVDLIPFGEIEGVGWSDPTRLTEVYGWSIRRLIRAHVIVSVLALGMVAAFYVRGLLVTDDEEP